MVFRPYDPKLKTLSRKLRKEMTATEQRLWSLLRRKQILGIQFYRERTVGRYIVDFIAPAVKLVVEVDGSQHLDPEQVVQDAQRTRFLNGKGLMVLRFDDRQVLVETEGVLTEIHRVCEERLNPP